MPDDYTTLVSCETLADHWMDPNWLVVDCRFALADTGRGRRDYLSAHIAGAVYAHLDEDLAAPVIPGQTGRHPLPTPQEAARRLGGLGIGPGVQVVAYDDAGGALAAVRLWWMLRWLGHSASAVLDGGWQRWQALGLPQREGIESRPAQTLPVQLNPELCVDTAQVDQARLDPSWRVLDSRAADRYQGQNETIDPIAGHIPGAISAPYGGNLNADGAFRSPDQLRRRFERILTGIPAERAIVYCGSGVTSIHNILAMQVAGLGEARLYAGSWSEWITHPDLTIATT